MRTSAREGTLIYPQLSKVVDPEKSKVRGLFGKRPIFLWVFFQKKTDNVGTPAREGVLIHAHMLGVWGGRV